MSHMKVILNTVRAHETSKPGEKRDSSKEEGVQFHQTKEHSKSRLQLFISSASHFRPGQLVCHQSACLPRCQSRCTL